MTPAEIIQALSRKLTTPVGRQLYAVVGSYKALDAFQKDLAKARTNEGKPFPKPVSVNREVLSVIPDEEFKLVAEKEAKRPEVAAAHVQQAFQTFLRAGLQKKGLLVLADLELLFAYRVDLDVLRTLAADQNQVLLLLPGKREEGRVKLFPDWPGASYLLPTTLIAEDHQWETSLF